MLEKFRSGDQGLAHIEKLVIEHGGQEVWRDNKAPITALFSDDGVRPEVPGMLRGGQTIKHIIHLGPGRALEVEFSVNGTSKDSDLEFDGDTKYEFEHTSDNTNTVGHATQNAASGTASSRATSHIPMGAIPRPISVLARTIWG